MIAVLIFWLALGLVVTACLKRLRGRDNFPVVAGSATSYDGLGEHYIYVRRKAASEARHTAEPDALPLHVSRVLLHAAFRVAVPLQNVAALHGG